MKMPSKYDPSELDLETMMTAAGFPALRRRYALRKGKKAEAESLLDQLRELFFWGF